MSDSEPATTILQGQLITLWKWPIPLATALLSLMLFLGPSEPITMVFLIDMVIVGGGTFLCGILLWRVALPMEEAGLGSETALSIKHHRAIAAPTALLGALIAGLGCAVYRLAGDPVAAKVAAAAFFLAILAVCGAMIARAWRARK